MKHSTGALRISLRLVRTLGMGVFSVAAFVGNPCDAASLSGIHTYLVPLTPRLREIEHWMPQWRDALDGRCQVRTKPLPNESPSHYFEHQRPRVYFEVADLDCVRKFYPPQKLAQFARNGDLVAKYAQAILGVVPSGTVCNSAVRQELIDLAAEAKVATPQYIDDEQSKSNEALGFPDPADVAGLIEERCGNKKSALELYSQAFNLGDPFAAIAMQRLLNDGKPKPVLNLGKDR
jgi:hypothetical protein